MKFAMTPRLRRLSAVSLLIVVAWLLLELTVLPLYALYHESRQKLDNLIYTVDRYARDAAQRDTLRLELGRYATTAKQTDGYLNAASAPLATAELQARVKRLVEARQGQLVSVQTLPQAQEEGFPRVSVRVHLRCTVACLQQLFYQLETGKPQLFLDRLVLSAPLQRRSDPDGAERLDADFQLSGYLRG